MTIEWSFMVWLKRGTSRIYQVVERPTSQGTLLRVFRIIAPYQTENGIVKIDFIWNSIILEHSKGQLFIGYKLHLESQKMYSNVTKSHLITNFPDFNTPDRRSIIDLSEDTWSWKGQFEKNEKMEIN